MAINSFQDLSFLSLNLAKVSSQVIAGKNKQTNKQKTSFN